jgi:Helix-turn-helix domain
MSIRVMDAVRQRSNAKGSARLVLMFLAWYANDDGLAWPSQATLARDAALDVRNVRHALAILLAMGEVVAVGRAKRGVVTYRITPGGAQPRAEAPYVDGSEPRAEAPYVDDPTQGGGILGRRRPRAEPPCQPRAEPPSHLGRSRPTNRQEPSYEPSKVVAAECQQAVDEWNVVAGELGLARVQRLTTTRQSKLTARLKDAGGLDGWRVALAKIRDTPGLRGENDRRWRCDFDWIIAETNFCKLLEGKYDEWGTKPANGDGRAGRSGHKRAAYDAVFAGLAATVARKRDA